MCLFVHVLWGPGVGLLQMHPVTVLYLQSAQLRCVAAVYFHTSLHLATSRTKSHYLAVRFYPLEIVCILHQHSYTVNTDTSRCACMCNSRATLLCYDFVLLVCRTYKTS